MKYLLPILLLFCASCVTAADLRAIEDAQYEYRMSMDRTFGELQRDAITAEEADARIESAQKTLEAEIADVVDTVEARTDSIAKAAKQLPTDPMSVISYVVGLGAAVAGSSKLAARKVNKERDMARRLRGERTSVEPPVAS